MAWRSVILRTTGEIITAAIYNETNFYNMRYLKGQDGVIALEDSITLPAGKTVDGTDISAHVADASAHHPRSHDHSLAADGTPIAVAGIPDLDASKITTGRFPMARMPDGEAGLVLTAQGAGANPAYTKPIVNIVRKTVAETVYDSAVLQPDNHLFFPMAANETWEFKVYILASSETATPKIRCNFAIPSGATHRFKKTADAFGGNADEHLDVTNVIYLFVIHGLVTNSTTAGNLHFQWAQWTARPENTTIWADSCLIAHKVK